MTDHPLVEKIDIAYVEQHPERDKPFRAHLGGSMIGRECDRELFYSFRWFLRPAFAGRMLRLFDRGHKEEFRFVAYLRSVGIEVNEYSETLWLAPTGDYLKTPARFSDTPPTEPEIEATCEDVTGQPYHMEAAKEQGVELKQWRIEGVDGHFGGSLDGIARAPFDLPIWYYREGSLPQDTGRVLPAGEKFLLEFKTHNTKSFAHLIANGVEKSKPVHWTQMQTYMGKRDLKYALYMAVNKNDDSLFVQVIERDDTVAPRSEERASKIIYGEKLPDRIAKNAANFGCKFCDFVRVCHYSEFNRVDRNCRSCKHASPVADGKWQCGKWAAIIPSDAILTGCDSHEIITD